MNARAIVEIRVEGAHSHTASFLLLSMNRSGSSLLSVEWLGRWEN